MDAGAHCLDFHGTDVTLSVVSQSPPDEGSR